MNPIPRATEHQGNLGAALWIIYAAGFFVGVGILVKLLGAEIGVGQILFLRQLVMLIILLPMLKHLGRTAYQTQELGLQGLRVLLGGSALAGGFYAVIHIELADATVIGFSKVMFVTLIAWIFLNEKVGVRRFSATLLGFIGVVIILNPSAASINYHGLIALASAACAGGAMVTVKVLSRKDSAKTLILYQATWVGILCLPFAIYQWHWPDLQQWVMLIGVGLLSYAGQYCNVVGYRDGEASFIAPFDYFRLLGAVAFGYLIFDETPSWRTATGATLIIAASIYTVYRELKLKNLKSQAIE